MKYQLLALDLDGTLTNSNLMNSEIIGMPSDV